MNLYSTPTFNGRGGSEPVPTITRSRPTLRRAAVSASLFALTCCAIGARSAGNAAMAASAAPIVGLTPFTAQYTAEWRSISVGTSSLELKTDTVPGHYQYVWTITARGIFRVIYNNDVIQRSWFELVDGQVRPLKYHAEDGASTVSIVFDWQAQHATGVSEKKPVDIKLSDGMQDIMSIQVEVMASLQRGELAKSFRIIEKDAVKDFVYTQEGTAHLRTEIGELDTIVVSSHREGGNRILKMWFAPALGFAPVQAERTRDGKLDFAMRLKQLTPSAK